MKTIIACLIALSIYSNGLAQITTVTDLVEANWVGVTEQDANFTQSGKCHLVSTMNLVLYSDNSVSGTMTTKMTLDYVTYTSTYHVTGTFNESDWTLTVKDDYSTYADALPGDLYWCKGHGTYTFFKDAEKEGSFILKGTSYSDCAGASEVEFSAE